MNLRIIIIILSLLAIIATGTGSYFSYQSLVIATLDAAHSDAEKSTEEASQQLNTIILENKRAAKILAGHDKLKNALLRNDERSLSAANAVLDFFQEALDANVCYLMDINGITIASSNRNSPGSFVGKDYSFRLYFREAISGGQSVYMALGVTSEVRGLYTAHPVYGKDNTTINGIAVIKTSIERITNSLMYAHDGIITVISPQDLIFISNNEEILYKFLWKKTGDVIEELRNSKQFGRGPWEWSGFRILHRHHGDDIVHAVDSAGIEYHVHEKNIEQYPGWKVVYLHRHDSAAQRIAAPVFRTAKIVIALLLVITGIFVFLLYKKASEEILERRELEKRLLEMSITDELTGLYNRRGFFELGEHQYHAAVRDNNPMSIFYIDMDDMKAVNDKFGHKEGDNALKDLAEILLHLFRKSDIVARLGGDEFSILMTREANYKPNKNISNRIENSINDFNRVTRRPYKLKVSIGEVVYDPSSPMDFEAFVHNADEIMYRIKRKKKGASKP